MNLAMTLNKFLPERWQKEQKRKDSFDRQLLDMDFFCQLSYMAAISTSGLSRSEFFNIASKLPYISARYFKKVVFVAKAFNHDYAEACRIVAQATKEPEIKALLLRLSGALASGEDTSAFLERESDVFSGTYGNRYERRLESLRKWTDAYVALIMTSALVTIMAVVSMIVGNVTVPFILTLASLTIVVTIAGVWLLYRTAPREIKVHSLSCRSKEQDLARNVFRLTMPLLGVIVIALLVLKVNLGWVMLVAGAFLFPLGLISILDDRKIDNRDSEIAGFLRSLGGISQAIGATTTEAMGRLDFRSMGSLKEDVKLLHSRLLAGIDPNLCWDRFVGETGSEQVNRSVRIFWDAVSLGGEPERVGKDASKFAMQISLLREKRKLIASGFSWLAILMHAIMVALIVFIFKILNVFSELVQTIMPGDVSVESIPMVSPAGFYTGDSVELNLLHSMVIAITIVLTFANALAIYSTSGGHLYKFVFYLAITMVISGAALLFVPPIVTMMFSGIT
jgi:flagellar protein FlaJ